MKDATLILRDLTKLYGTPTPLTATLKDNDTPLANRTVVFHIHGVDYNRITDASGKVSLNINLGPGTYPTSVRFIGDSTYNEVTRECIVRVMSNSIPQQEIKSPANYFEVNKIHLWVLSDNNGFDVKPGQNIKETMLLHDSENFNTPTFYFNSGFDGDEFEINIVMKEEYLYNGQQVMAILNAWNKTNIPVSVVTDAMVVANGKYTLQIRDKKQTKKGYSIWKLRFKQYYENSLSFEAMYDQKTSTLSSIDQLLLKQTTGINEKSSKSVITALQQKMQSIGFWPERIDGSYSGLPSWAYNFQRDIMKEINHAPGLKGIDYETITALVAYSHGVL